ncbi:alpha/beta fold hydrolase [Demequina soli]|uniref:alpha/beta fold hydrolase n=1 Tax=Demequina soli TaxID=1638987 RepID=UPI00078583C8|nr:alpha/beta hydrolase [Demequina soli]
MDTGLIRAAGAELRYRRLPRDGARTLLLLHGITDGAAAWSRVADALAPGYDLVMPDARGHGGSSRVDAAPDVATLAADAAAVLDALSLGPVLVWGHSMGAETAAALAASRPDLVAAAVLEDPPFGRTEAAEQDGPDPHLDGFAALLADMRSMSEGERLAVATRQNPTWDAAENEAWAATKAQFDPTMLALLARGLGLGWRHRLAAMRCPVLLVTGDPELGAIVTPEIAAAALEALPDGRAVRIAGAGHSIHRDRFDQTLAHVLAFLAEAAPGR